jgi:hypothetical protein
MPSCGCLPIHYNTGSSFPLSATTSNSVALANLLAAALVESPLSSVSLAKADVWAAARSLACARQHQQQIDDVNAAFCVHGCVFVIEWR